MDLVSMVYSFMERKLFPFKPSRRRDAVPSCSRGYICNIYPNITKSHIKLYLDVLLQYEEDNTICDSSNVVMEETFCLLPLMSEYEQNNNNCYSSHIVMEDRLSQLPDEILESILSQLTLREAVRASSLSSRWRYLWMHVTHLNFDVISEIPYKARKNSDFLKKERLRNMNFINQVMNLHTCHTLEEFNLRFLFENSFKYEIDKWLLKVASSKKLESLKLFMPMEHWRKPDRYSIPIELLHHNASLFGFRSLKSLTLECIDVCNQVANLFLSNCPLLEQLSIRLSRVLKHLEIGPSLKLKHLEIYLCDIDYLKICNVNLISFSFSGTEETNLCLENVSSVVNLQIEGFDGSLLRLIDLITAKFSQVVKLSLEANSLDLRCLDFDHSFPKFNNLKWLILTLVGATDNIPLGVAPFLQASPYLEMFELKNKWDDTRIYDRTIISLLFHNPFQHLKVVRYECYLGGRADEEFTKYILDYSLALEKFIVIPCCDHKNSKVERRARSRAWRKLQGKFPQGVELVIL